MITTWQTFTVARQHQGAACVQNPSYARAILPTREVYSIAETQGQTLMLDFGAELAVTNQHNSKGLIPPRSTRCAPPARDVPSLRTDGRPRLAAARAPVGVGQPRTPGRARSARRGSASPSSAATRSTRVRPYSLIVTTKRALLAFMLPDPAPRLELLRAVHREAVGQPPARRQHGHLGRVGAEMRVHVIVRLWPHTSSRDASIR